MKRGHVIFGGLIRRVIRNFGICELISIILYLVYRTYTPQETASANDAWVTGFSACFHVLSISAAIVGSKVYNAKKQIIGANLLFIFFALICDSFHLSVIVESLHTAATIVIVSTFVFFDIALALTLLYAHYGFSWQDIDAHETASNEGKYDEWDYHKKLENGGPSFTKWAVSMALVIEATCLYFYVIFAFSIRMNEESGWVFLSHFFTCIVATWWIVVDEANTNNTAAYNWLFGLAFGISFFDIVQIIRTARLPEGDIPLFVGIRAMLFICAMLYLVGMWYSGSKWAREWQLNPPDSPVGMFVIIQKVFPPTTMCELMLIAAYFIFVCSVKSNSSIVWSIFLHFLTAIISTALTAASAPSSTETPNTAYAELSKTLYKTTMALIVISLILFMNDLFVAQIVQGYELAFFIPLIVVDIIYVFLGIFLLAKGTAEEEIKDWVDYFILVAENQLTPENVTDAMLDSYQDDEYDKYGKKKDVRAKIGFRKASDSTFANLLRKGAVKIYLVIFIVVKRTMIVESGLLYGMLVTMVYQLEIPDAPHGEPEWYQWFYVLHFFPIVAAAMASTFRVDTELSMLFLIISALICLVADVFLVSFLITKVAIAIIPAQFAFILVDISNIVVYFVLKFKTLPGSFSSLRYMDQFSRAKNTKTSN